MSDLLDTFYDVLVSNRREGEYITEWKLSERDWEKFKKESHLKKEIRSQGVHTLYGIKFRVSEFLPEGVAAYQDQEGKWHLIKF